jgi:putative tricarboxylic transport membrane protein
MDAFFSLMQGLTIAVQPINLMFALIGVLLGTAVGVLPGIGPALTVALLLPDHLQARPGRLADHVRGHLLRRHVWRLDDRHPDQHAGRERLHGDRARGNKMAKAGRGGPALATAAIGSFVAGTIATLGITFLAPVARRSGGDVRPGGLLRADVRRLRHRLGDLRQSPVRGLTSLSSASRSGSSASTS